MPQISLPIGNYAYTDPSVSSRMLENCTAEPLPDGKQPAVVKRMPGIDTFVTVGSACRGGVVFKGKSIVLSSQTLFSIDTLGNSTSIGTIPGDARVNMDINAFEIVIVAETKGYVSDGVTTIRITDSFFNQDGGVEDVVFIDGFFIFTRPNSQITFNSKLNSTTFSALDFTSIEGSPDNIKGLIVEKREVFYAGEQSFELFFDAGLSPGFPLARSSSGFVEQGCAAGQTLAKIDNTVYWLAEDQTVRKFVGVIPTVVSSPGISNLIRSEDASKAFGFTYVFEEKFYYVLTFPGLTLEYDILASQWHKRTSKDKDFWTPTDIIEFDNSLLVLDSVTGKVGKLNSDTKTEFGDIQVMKWVTQPIYQEGRRIFHDRLELKVSVGRGVTSGQGSDPEIILSISDDGGSTFNEYQRRDLDKAGEKDTRVVWHNLGSSYNRVYEWSVSDPVDVFVTDINEEIRIGTS